MDGFSVLCVFMIKKWITMSIYALYLGVWVYMCISVCVGMSVCKSQCLTCVKDSIYVGCFLIFFVIYYYTAEEQKL